MDTREKHPHRSALGWVALALLAALVVQASGCATTDRNRYAQQRLTLTEAYTQAADAHDRGWIDDQTYLDIYDALELAAAAQDTARDRLAAGAEGEDIERYLRAARRALERAERMLAEGGER